MCADKGREWCQNRGWAGINGAISGVALALVRAPCSFPKARPVVHQRAEPSILVCARPATTAANPSYLSYQILLQSVLPGRY